MYIIRTKNVYKNNNFEAGTYKKTMGTLGNLQNVNNNLSEHKMK